MFNVSPNVFFPKPKVDSAVISMTRKKNINLIEAFRVSQYLIVLASQFLPKGNERDFFLDQRRTAKMAKETPLLYYAENFDDEKEKLYEMVRERQLMNDRIAILFPQNRQVFGFAQGLREIGIEVEVPNKQNSKNNAHRTHDFTSNRPKLMSYHSAKGLTFDSVFLPRLVKRSFSWLSDENVEKLLFMAITRATKWAYFSTAEDNPLEILYKLESLEESGTIKLLRGTEDRRSKSTSSSKKDGDDLDFL